MPSETERAIEWVRKQTMDREEGWRPQILDVYHLLSEHDRLKAELERLTKALENTRANLDRMTYYDPEMDQFNVDLIVEEVKLALCTPAPYAAPEGGRP